MLGSILLEAKLEPTLVIGGIVNKFNSKILDIDVDDNLSSIMIYKNFKQKFYINLNLSMASSEEERKVNFVYRNFTIDCNLIKNTTIT